MKVIPQKFHRQIVHFYRKYRFQSDQEKTMVAKVDKNICVGCQACVSVCPVDAIRMEDGKAVVDPEKCIDCGTCVAECPVKAIEQI
jgi:NAD-dependent dihydropyrimidine dehydrogenase PreA subunit